MRTVRESVIEKRLCHEAAARGWLCWKLHADSVAGIPDRLLLGPGGRTVFVELKRAGEKPRPIQNYQHERLRSLGFEVHVIDNVDDIRKVFDI